MKDVLVIVGAGVIGQAIARRLGAGKQLLLTHHTQAGADEAAERLADFGYDVRAMVVDIASRDSVQALVERAQAMGPVTGLVQAAGVSPSQAPIEAILKVDLYGTALVLELFGSVMARGGAGLVISSQSGHRLPALTPEQDRVLALTPTEELLGLPLLAPSQVRDTLHAYQLSKRGNALRVMAEAVRWGRRGARVNTLSPGIILTPLARDELNGPRGAGYRRMIEGGAAGRAGTADELAQVAALLMGPDGGFISGSDFLVDGGVTAAWHFGDLATPAATA